MVWAAVLKHAFDQFGVCPDETAPGRIPGINGEKSMQAWQSAQVKNPDSEHADRAGTIVRVEKKGENELVYVNLDADSNRHAEVVSFVDSELVLL